MAEATAKQIEAAAAAYKPCSVRAAILYFVLNDLAGVDPMYQFSLDAYNDLFLISIQKSAKSDKLEERIKSLNEYHTYAVYKYTSRSACCYTLQVYSQRFWYPRILHLAPCFTALLHCIDHISKACVQLHVIESPSMDHAVRQVYV